MAGDWIKMQKSLPRDPRVVRISSALKADRLRTVGGLLSAWCLFDEQTEDGKLEGYTPELMDEIVGFPGLAQAMESVGWLEIGDGFLVVPRFEEHNGQSAKRRAQDSDRKMSARKADKCPQTKRTDCGPEKRREEKSNLLSEGSAKSQRFIKPTIQEIEEHGASMIPPFRQSSKFHAYYESNGWKVGRNPMKDWRAAMRTWSQTEKPDHRETKSQQEFSNIRHSLPILHE